jgi:hypothetical protein
VNPLGICCVDLDRPLKKRLDTAASLCSYGDGIFQPYEGTCTVIVLLLLSRGIIVTVERLFYSRWAPVPTVMTL